MTDEQFQRMLGVEHGGMNEVLADLYSLTHEEKYLALAERFCHQAILTPLSEGLDALNGLHSNTQIPKVVGFERLYQLTDKPHYHAAAEFFWRTVAGTRSFVTGGNGDNEHFFPTNDFARHISSAKTMETCCSYNMLRLTRLLFANEPTAAYADYYEKTLYNTILASQDPDTGMMTYFQSTRPGYLKLFCTPFDSFWCCTGTGIENHAKYGAATASVKVNGHAAASSHKPGSFIALQRRWKTGDVVEVEMPMALRMEPLPGTADTAAVVYGPIVLVGALGHEVKSGDDLYVNERTIGSVFNEPIDVPTFAVELADIPQKIKPSGAPLTFKSDGIGRPTDVTLIPYYKTVHQHYNMYWKIQKA